MNPNEITKGPFITLHTFSKALSGDVVHVRQRIVRALEEFNYVIVNEQPLSARRDGSFSMNVLDCPLSVDISFRQSSPSSTTAILNYTIPLSMITKGDRHTIEREGEAIVAFAAKSQVEKVCVICGTLNSEDSRFCRGCGVPCSEGLPAELEVMRLTAGARAGHQTIVAGLIIIIFVLLVIGLPLLLIPNIRHEAFWQGLLILGQLAGWGVLSYGILRLHRTLNPKNTREEVKALNDKRVEFVSEPAALPPQSAWSSITEGTTNLLDDRRRETAATPVDRPVVDTNEIE